MPEASEAEHPVLRPPPTARWDWGYAACMYVMGIAGCVFLTFFLQPLLGHGTWWVNGDVWYTTNSAQYVANGAPGFVYSANPFYSALPGFIYLYAPVVALADHLGLISGYPLPLAHPSMLILTGPFFFICGATGVFGVDFLAFTLGVSRARRRAIATGLAVLVIAPTPGIEGHPEDLLALALATWALAYLIRGRFTSAAMILSGAILVQTWAGLLLPVLLVASPPGLRLRALIRATAAPVILTLVLLALDFRDAATDLLRQPMPDTGQHLPWWSLAGHLTVSNMGVSTQMVSGSTTRSLALIVAGLAAWKLCRRVTPERILLAAGIATYARCLFEVEYWPYYVAPAVVLLVVLAARTTVGDPKRFIVAIVSGLLLYFHTTPSYMHIVIDPWWALAIVVSSGALCISAASGGVISRLVLPASLRSFPALGPTRSQ